MIESFALLSMKFVRCKKQLVSSIIGIYYGKYNFLCNIEWGRTVI